VAGKVKRMAGGDKQRQARGSQKRQVEADWQTRDRGKLAGKRWDRRVETIRGRQKAVKTQAELQEVEEDRQTRGRGRPAGTR
jgi:hypothetical protein